MIAPPRTRYRYTHAPRHTPSQYIPGSLHDSCSHASLPCWCLQDDFDSHKHHQSLFCLAKADSSVAVHLPIAAPEDEVSPYLSQIHGDHPVSLSLTGTSRLFKAEDGTIIDLDTGATLVVGNAVSRSRRVRRGDRSLSVGTAPSLPSFLALPAWLPPH